ncbi:MAG: BMP family ABC transporter substrate-binding protein, partial [Lachnospiraceae bacterium]|nr:BMP family ABC transporter substrate-binding protein [Lachnospiraceae bacterium]
MKKKLIAMVLAASMVLSLAACGSSAADTSAPAATDTEEAAPAEDTADAAADTAASSGSTTDVAFVTDVGNIDDQSFNQYTWAGVQQFCQDNGLTANYYKPSEDSDAARVEQMDNAVKDGAKGVVMAGYLFAAALEEA